MSKDTLSRRQIVGGGAAIFGSSVALGMLAVSARAAASKPPGPFEFRDALRPGSEESSQREYAPIAWNAKDQEVVRGRLGVLIERASGLLSHGAMDGPISLYRIDEKGVAQAKGQYRRLILNGNAFPRPGYDWLTRIMAHELTHTADPYYVVAVDPEWTALVEPKIQVARALLAKNGLTTIEAASMPLGERRTKLEAQIRAKTRLPSAYSAHNMEETMAEIVSFMLDKNSNYKVPPEIADFLHKRLLNPGTAAKFPAGEPYREGLRLASLGRYFDAVASYSEALRLHPDFILALVKRAESYKKLNDNTKASKDFARAVTLSPRYGRFTEYLVGARDAAMRQ